MSTKRYAKLPRRASARSSRSDIVRRLIAAALLRAISVQGATNSQAARWLKVSPRTLFAWAHCETSINVETVLACPQLAHVFVEVLELSEEDAQVRGACYISALIRDAVFFSQVVASPVGSRLVNLEIARAHRLSRAARPAHR